MDQKFRTRNRPLEPIVGQRSENNSRPIASKGCRLMGSLLKRRRVQPIYFDPCGELRQAGEGGGGFMGWVIRIIFDPNTRQWGGGGVYGVGDPWITFGSFLDHFRPFCSLYLQLCANGLVDLCIIFWKPNCRNK